MTDDERERLAHEVDIVQGLLTQAKGLLLSIQDRYPQLAGTRLYLLTEHCCLHGATHAGQLAEKIRTEKEREWKE